MSSVAVGVAPAEPREHATAELDPDLTAQIEASRGRWGRSLGGRDRLAALGMAAGFLAATIPLAAFLPSARSPGVAAIALLLAAYALASRATFEVRTGLVLPTQLVLVPMLFVLPLGYVPRCVAGGLLLGRVRELVTGGSRSIAPCSSS